MLFSFVHSVAKIHFVCSFKFILSCLCLFHVLGFDEKLKITNCAEQKSYESNETLDLTLSEFVERVQREPTQSHNRELLYLKDWHFQKHFPNFVAYETPVFFRSDWLNEYWDEKNDSVELDYRFVYVGVAGTWTPYHADVFRSFSWSANVGGRKLWYLTEPGVEVSIGSSSDIRKCERFSSTKFVEFVQNAGEVLFVPSSWHHQVHNLDNVISINHNWCNAANVQTVWTYMRNSLKNVKNEIKHLADSLDDFDEQCQVILKADIGLNYPEFFDFVYFVREKRRKSVEDFSAYEDFRRMDMETRKRCFMSKCTCQPLNNFLCPSCVQFLHMYDYETSSYLLTQLMVDDDFKRLSVFDACCEKLAE